MYSRTAVRAAEALYAGASSRRHAPSQFHMTPDRPRTQLSPNKCETPLMLSTASTQHISYIEHLGLTHSSPHVTMRLTYLTVADELVVVVIIIILSEEIDNADLVGRDRARCVRVCSMLQTRALIAPTLVVV